MKKTVIAMLLAATVSGCQTTINQSQITQVQGDNNRVATASASSATPPNVSTHRTYRQQQQHPSRVCHRDTLRHYAFTIYRKFNCYGELISESRRYR